MSDRREFIHSVIRKQTPNPFQFNSVNMIISALIRQARSCIIGGPVTQTFAFTANRAFAALAANPRNSETPVQHRTEAPPLRALLLDVAGTLLSPSEPAALVIQRYARPYGCTLSELDILKNFRKCAPLFSGPCNNYVRFRMEPDPIARHRMHQSGVIERSFTAPSTPTRFAYASHMHIP